LSKGCLELDLLESARMPVPKFVCEVAYASGFASSANDCVPWDTGSIVWKARPNSITLERGNLGTHMRASTMQYASCVRLVLLFATLF
jgi:hypothetical protein